MTARATGRLWLVAVILAIAALTLSIYVNSRYTGLIECLRVSAEADQRRTSAIAAATDAERIADLTLLRDRTDEHRAAAIAARENTDRVRAENPAPATAPCQ